MAPVYVVRYAFECMWINNGVLSKLFYRFLHDAFEYFNTLLLVYFFVHSLQVSRGCFSVGAKGHSSQISVEWENVLHTTYEKTLKEFPGRFGLC